MHGYGYGYGVGAFDPSTRARGPLSSAQRAAQAMEQMLNEIEPHAKFGRTGYTDEVAAYQRAGQFGVSSVGPAIDAAGAPSATQPLTHQAWDLNGQMHSLESWGPLGPGYQEVQQARALAWHMLVRYKQAIQALQQAQFGAGPQVAQHPVPQAVAPRVARPSSVQVAAQALLAAIQAASQAGKSARWSREFGQPSNMWQPTANFQKAYNKASGGSLTVDGVFGGETTAALQSVTGTSAILAAMGQRDLLPAPPGQAAVGWWW